MGKTYKAYVKQNKMICIFRQNLKGFFAALSAGHAVTVVFKHFGYYKGQILVVIDYKYLFLHILLV